MSNPASAMGKFLRRMHFKKAENDKQGDKRTRNSESEVNSDRSVSLGRQGRLDYVNFGTYVPRI
jgi:hypothetical protein